MRAANEVRILAVGFGSFPGVRVNPSAMLADRLKSTSRRLERFGAIRMFTGVLPVSWRESAHALRGLLRRARPDIVILIGLAGRRTALSVESRALNRRSILRPDAQKLRAASAQVRPGAPFTRSVRAPAARLAVAMRRAGTPARLSIHAGDYLCNESLYAALEATEGLVLFIHVPRPRDARAPLSRRRWRRTPTLDAMARALFAILPPLLVERRAHRAHRSEAAAA